MPLTPRRRPQGGDAEHADPAAAERDWVARVRAGDQAAFEAMFDEVRAFFGSFTAEALDQSSFLIDRLVERG